MLSHSRCMVVCCIKGWYSVDNLVKQRRSPWFSVAILEKNYSVTHWKGAMSCCSTILYLPLPSIAFLRLYRWIWFAIRALPRLSLHSREVVTENLIIPTNILFFPLSLFLGRQGRITTIRHGDHLLRHSVRMSIGDKPKTQMISL